MIEIITNLPLETEAFGQKVASSIQGKNVFIALYGDLGAGKTAFVRGLASVLSPGSRVKSPTYTIVNEYGEEEKKLCHFDMYRIDSEDDLESIGFYDYTDCIIIAEWSEKIPFALPDTYYTVSIEKVSETERLITIEYLT